MSKYMRAIGIIYDAWTWNIDWNEIKRVGNDLLHLKGGRESRVIEGNTRKIPRSLTTNYTFIFNIPFSSQSVQMI